MKKVSLVMMIIAAALAFASCKSSKQVVQTPPPGRTEIELPCVDESMDNDEYFRAMGTATNMNMQNARSAAFDAAKSMLNKRLGGFITGLSTDYSRTVAGDAQMEKVQRMMEGEFYQVVERMLNDAAKTCEKMYQNQTGNYESFIAIQVSKKELVNKMADRLSDNQELEIEFNRDQFRKFAEKKMKELQDMQNR
ncbi:MAG: hypothetical protein IKZ52_01615 [Bacteroidales bacterium]|nr:hypothetical protein [Bacteroidales bacterium]